MEKESHVVVIFPHPDDESFGTAGSIYNFRKAGTPVTYLCGTLGEMGRNMAIGKFANRETLSQYREAELKDACDYLDINYRLLGLRDKTIEFEHPEVVIEKVQKELEDIKPSLVITHFPKHGVHPDHNALCEATIEAVRRMDESERPTLWAAAITKDFEKVLGQPDVVIPVQDKAHFEFKMNAILKHKSQAEGLLKEMEASSMEEMDERMRGLQQRLGYERFFIWDFDK